MDRKAALRFGRYNHGAGAAIQSRDAVGNLGERGRFVGEADLDRNGRAVDTEGDLVECGMTAGLDLDVDTFPFELAVQDAGPEVEGLADGSDVFGFLDGEADAE